MVELVRRLWNGSYGRLVRRDIWLYRQVTWRVRIRRGDGDGSTTEWSFDTEEEATGMVDRLVETGGPGWRELSGGAPDAPPGPPRPGP